MEIFEGNSEQARAQQTTFPGVIEKLLVFPDGSSTTVSFYVPFQGVEEVGSDDGTRGGFYEELAALAAEGNATAARYLLRQLKRCDAWPVSEVELQAALSVLGPSADPRSQEHRMRLQDMHRRCDGVNQHQINSAGALVRLAADAGDHHSAILYANHIRETDPATASAYFLRAWNAGDPEGLSGVASIILDGSTDVPPEAAYAYVFTSEAIQLVLEDGLASELFSASRDRRIRSLQLLEDQYDEQAIAAGLQLAREMVASNPSCCNMSRR